MGKIQTEMCFFISSKQIRCNIFSVRTRISRKIHEKPHFFNRKKERKKINEKQIKPMQFLGPPLNGRNAYGFRLLTFSGKKWSGLNSSASSPQRSARYEFSEQSQINFIDIP